MENISNLRNCLQEYESKEAELGEITTMLWYILEDYWAGQSPDLYTKANNYDRLYTYLFNVHSLLLDRLKEMQTYIDKQYELKKKEGVNQCM